MLQAERRAWIWWTWMLSPPRSAVSVAIALTRVQFSQKKKTKSWQMLKPHLQI
jgi:hypothetical protein